MKDDDYIADGRGQHEMWKKNRDKYHQSINGPVVFLYSEAGKGTAERRVPVQIKVLHDFFDKTAHLALRKAGERLEVPEQRAGRLISMKLAEPLPEQKKEAKKTAAG